MERAVDLDAEQCLREGELSEELRVSRKEVVGMFLEEYDAELHERILRQKEYFIIPISLGHCCAFPCEEIPAGWI